MTTQDSIRSLPGQKVENMTARAAMFLENRGTCIFDSHAVAIDVMNFQAENGEMAPFGLGAKCECKFGYSNVPCDKAATSYHKDEYLCGDCTRECNV